MIAKLEFDLDKYEDQQAHRRCVKASDMVGAINEINEIIRKRVKYGYLPDAVTDELEKVREEITGIIDNHELWRVLDGE